MHEDGVIRADEKILGATPEQQPELVIVSTIDSHLAKATELDPGKYSITLTGGKMLIIDIDNPILVENEVAFTPHALAEIHETESDQIECKRGPMVFWVAERPDEGLVNRRPATDNKGSIRQGEFVGDGIIGGKIYTLNEGDVLTIPPRFAHLHGTVLSSPEKPREIAASTFSKGGKNRRFN